QDRVPIDGVPTGPREVKWRPTEASTLVWVEAMDGGNPKEKVPHRDRLVMLKAPFSGEPQEIFTTEQRCRGLEFGEAVATEFGQGMDIETGGSEPLFRSDANAYETFVAMLDDSGTRILTERETPKDAPNFYVRTLGPQSSARALTKYPDPTPQLRGIRKQLVTY